LKVLVKIALAVGLAAILSSCGTSPGYSYTVGGTVTGMVGSGLVLQNNLGDDEKITVNSVFSFPTALTDGAAYSVTVQTPPTSPSQTCVVSNGSGTINGAPVSNVIVNCTMSAGPVVVDPSNSFAYVSNFNSTNISAYAIQSGGSLSQITGPFTAGTNPNPVTFYPQTSGASAYYAYVSNVSSGMSSGTISAYSIDNSSGALNPICGGSTQPVCPSTGEYPTQVAVATVSGNTYAYVANMGDGTISAYSIDNSSGALTPLCGGSGTACPLAGTSPTSVIIDPNNKLAYVPNMISGTISVFAINDDGTLSLVETALAGTYPISITVAAETSGTYAYVANMGSNDICVYTIDYNYASDNVLPLSQGTTIGTQGTSPMSVTIYPQTGGAGAYYAYVSNVGSQNISVFTITGGALSTPALVTTGVNPNPVTIYVDSSTTPPTAYAYVSNMGDGTIYTYTIGSGLLTNPQITYLTTNILFPSISSPTTVTIDSQGPYAYVSDMSTGIVAAFTITTGSGPLGGQLTRVQ
jgi:6-phosphogluconolactonase (cycloisomerase 2 family)